MFLYAAVFWSSMAEKQVTTVVIGAGCRGSEYANYALDFPEKFKVIFYMIFCIVYNFSALALLYVRKSI